MYYDLYDEDKSQLENEKSNFEFYEMRSAGGRDFYTMRTEFYKSYPMPGFRICAHDECKSLGKLHDKKEDTDDHDCDGNQDTKKFAFPTKA